jgi:hypothetical protein
VRANGPGPCFGWRAILPARAFAECVCVQMGQARVLAACAVGSGEQDLNRWLAGPSPRSSHPVSHPGCLRACHDFRASYNAVGAHGGGAISPSSPPWRRPSWTPPAGFRLKGPRLTGTNSACEFGSNLSVGRLET